MKTRIAIVFTLTATLLLAGACASRQMMMSDGSTVMSDGSMMMKSSDGTMRAMTETEMRDHMTMMMSDSRFKSMLMDRCKSAGMMSNNTAMADSSSMSGNTSMAGGSSMSGNTSGSSSMSGGSSMASGSMSTSGQNMMVMNADGTSRAMTEREMRMNMDMMMKNPQVSQMMMSNCGSM
jgi:hypothetical protein